MDSTKVFSIVSLASATTVASFMALMIIRGTMPLIQMAPFIGLNGAIVGGLFYLGIDAMTSFSGKVEPQLVMVRDSRGQVLSIKTEGGQESEPFSFFGEETEEEEVFDVFEDTRSLSDRLGFTSTQIIDAIKTVLLIAVILETYMGAVYISNNFTPFMVVTTGSMEPTINVGDLIYVKGVSPSDLVVGDIITFIPPSDYIRGARVTHRIVSISYTEDEIYFKTQGDNNPSIDPWTITSDDIIGRQTAILPNIGSFFLWVKTPAGMASLASVLVVYMFWPNIMQVIGGRRR
jgi:signal peptidase I